MMSSGNTGIEQIENIRLRTIGILDNLTEKAREYQLSEAPNASLQYRQKIVENTYQVLVVGEAKRGKSSLITGQLFRTLVAHSGQGQGVFSVAFSANGQLLASGGADQKAKIWNRQGALMLTLSGHKGLFADV